MKTCTRCGGEFPIDRFPKRYDKKYPEARKSWCKTCENKRGHKKSSHKSNWTKARRDRILRFRQKAFEYKGGKCSNPECPISHLDLPIGAFDYHHRDPSTKVGGITALLSRLAGWETVQAELDKCDLLCCLCHRLEHLNTKTFPESPQS